MDSSYSDDFPSSFLYQRYDEPGGEITSVRRDGDGWRLDGTSVIAGRRRRAGTLGYDVRVDAEWRTRTVRVTGEVDGQRVSHAIRADGAGQWWLDDLAQPQVAGALDIDFEFSPATNLLAIRRLVLPVGAEAGVRSAWLRLRPIRLEPLEQRYRREGVYEYRYQAWVDDEPFAATLLTDRRGLVTRYGELWAGGEQPSELPPKGGA